jgi:hypothetical protein
MLLVWEPIGIRECLFFSFLIFGDFPMIAIPTKSGRAASQLRDALRILSWNNYKSEQKELVGKGKEFPSNFELYQAFDDEWKTHTVHQMELEELTKMIEEELGYSQVELNKIRSEYYEGRKQFRTGNSTAIAIANSSVVAPSSVVETEEHPYY